VPLSIAEKLMIFHQSWNSHDFLCGLDTGIRLINSMLEGHGIGLGSIRLLSRTKIRPAEHGIVLHPDAGSKLIHFLPQPW
jgi:hypothetical protein